MKTPRASQTLELANGFKIQRSLLGCAINEVLNRPIGCAAALAATAIVYGLPAEASPVFPAEFELSSLLTVNLGDGSDGVVINPVASEDRMSSVSGVGDINNDGIDDFAVGANSADPNGQRSGQCYLIYGDQNGFPAEFEVSSLLPVNGGDGTRGMVLNGIAALDRACGGIGPAGDMNADGIDDFVVSSFGATPNSSANGQVYVIFGSNAALPAEVELSSLLGANGGNGSFGFALNGGSIGNSVGGRVVSPGDVNSDGIDDLLISANSAGFPNSLLGESYVVYGRSTEFDAELELSSLATAGGVPGFVIKSAIQNDGAGRTVDAAGDVNNDGIPDLLIGAHTASTNSVQAGRAYVLYGNDAGFPAEVELSQLLTSNGGDGSSGFVVNGIESYDGAGFGLGAAGDINGDSIDDIVIGTASIYSYKQPSIEGQAYLVFGRDGNFPAEIELADLLIENDGDGSDGVVLHGIELADSTGRQVSSAGDFNHDGVNDVMIAARASDPNGERSGRTYVVFGRSNNDYPPEIELSTLTLDGGGDGSSGVVFNGIAASDALGSSVRNAGDVNGDGVDDILMGAVYADAIGQFSGQTYLVFGREQLADLDGDGVGDLVDNCTLISNALQRDSDEDGFGNYCDPDLDNNGVVNFIDLALFAETFLTVDENSDFNGDGVVNFLDFVILSSMYLLPPGPSAIAK